MTRTVVALFLLAVSMFVIFAGAAGMFVSWALGAAGLMLLASLAPWRRAAIAGLVTLTLGIIIGLVGSGVSVGAWGRPVFAMDGRARDLVNLLVIAGPLASCVTLAWGTQVSQTRTPRRLARAALGVGALFLLVVVAVANGERIAGLIGLLGAAVLLLTAAALATSIIGARRAAV